MLLQWKEESIMSIKVREEEKVLTSFVESLYGIHSIQARRAFAGART
jgi:hypothetical protein